MGLLDMCCPKKPKKSLDYVIKWVEDTDKTIKDLSDTVQELNKWKEDISEETLRPIFDEYAETYPWDNVPAFNAKADKVENAVAGNIASLDSEGNLLDSGKKPSDFVPNVSGAIEGNFPQFDADGNIQDSGNKAEDFALAGHSHSVIIDASTESSISIDEGIISIEIEREGSGGETQINADNIGNLHRALEGPDTTPTSGSGNLITSGGVYTELLGKASREGDGENFSVNKVVFSEGDARASIEKTDTRITEDDTDFWEVAGFNININGDRIEKTIPLAVGDLEALSSHDTEVTEGSSKLITSGAVYNAINAVPINIKIVSVGGRYRLLFDNSVYSHGPVVLPSNKIVTVSNVLEYDHSESTFIEETFLGLFYYEENQVGTYPVRIYIQIGGSCISFYGSFHTLSDNRIAFIPGDGSSYNYEGTNYNYSDASGTVVTFPPQS